MILSKNMIALVSKCTSVTEICLLTVFKFCLSNESHVQLRKKCWHSALLVNAASKYVWWVSDLGINVHRVPAHRVV
jgi:hypothetical protein